MGMSTVRLPPEQYVLSKAPLFSFFAPCLAACVCLGCVFVLIITRKPKKVFIKCLNLQKCYYGQAEIVAICLSRIPLISLSLFHLVAVLLEEPSDLYPGSVWILLLNVNSGWPGCLLKWRDSNGWASGCQPWLSLQPQEPDTQSLCREGGVWPGFFFGSSWEQLCWRQQVASSLLREREFSLHLVFTFFSSYGGEREESLRKVRPGAKRVQGRTGLQLPQSLPQSFPCTRHFPSSLLIPIQSCHLWLRDCT